MGDVILFLATMAVTGIRPFVPTVGHSWPMVYIAASHIFVGVMLTMLWQRRGRWVLGWICLAVPTILEAALFFTAGYRAQ